MNLREASIYLLWFGFKHKAGDPFTEKEFQIFCEAHDVTVSKAHILFIKPEDYEYTSGIPFKQRGNL